MPDISELSRRAWKAARTEHQPDYDSLVGSYQEMLHALAEAVVVTRRVVSTGILGTFEQNVLEEIIPERFHVQSAHDAITQVEDVQPYRVDDEVATPKRKKGSKK